MIYLKAYMPLSGMVYLAQRDLLGRQYRDEKVITALAAAGIISVKPGGISQRQSKRNTDQALAGVFAAALNPVLVSRLKAGKDFISYLLAARKTIPWAKLIGEATFISLCRLLANARKAWHASPRLPFAIDEHSATARAIDELLEVVGKKWNDAYFSVYDLAGGFSDDNDEVGEESEDEEMGDTTAGPSAMPSFNADQAETDIEMGDLAAALEEDTLADEITEGVDKMDIDDQEGYIE
ncbi:hypothetical protein F4677DRAFT_463706 [Hypoxylon crocopeplum]|nr:hypothetical protein F4677DRAFT_463706 [Hypoxylon crocopeplum]